MNEEDKRRAIIQSCANMLRATLGEMKSADADSVVRGVMIILESL